MIVAACGTARGRRHNHLCRPACQTGPMALDRPVKRPRVFRTGTVGQSAIVTERIETGSLGWSRESRLPAAIASTTSRPLVTWPKSVYFLGRRPPEPAGESRSGSRRSRFVAVPVKGRPAEADRLLPRYKGIYHVGCTDYPNPTYP